MSDFFVTRIQLSHNRSPVWVVIKTQIYFYVAQIGANQHVANRNKGTTKPIVLFDVEQFAQITLNLFSEFLLSQSHIAKIQPISHQKRAQGKLIPSETQTRNHSLGRTRQQIGVTLHLAGINVADMNQHNRFTYRFYRIGDGNAGV